MKTTKIILILFVASALFITACDDLLGDLLKFNSEWFPQEFSLDPSDQLGEIDLVSDVFSANIDSVLKANGITEENLRSTRISDARVTVLTEGYTFDPLTRIEFFMETPGLGKTKVAWLDTVPQGETLVNLKLNADNLQDYLMEDSFVFSVSGFLETKVPEVIDFLAEIRFVMKGGL